MTVENDDPTVYDVVGGMEFFTALADRFYERVKTDAVLLPLYPDPSDLPAASRRLALFLAQYWGGPPIYSEERGHPRLRARHFPFEIGPEERDHWLAAMRHAITVAKPSPEVEGEIERYINMAAEAMRNGDVATLGEVYRETADAAWTAKTRTMAVELDVENRDGRLAPGTFCQVRWPVSRPAPSLFVPSVMLKPLPPPADMPSVSESMITLNGSAPIRR